MEADNEHYKLHWEFFKSINPKATEDFFIKLQIEQIGKRLKEDKKNIDFADDSTGTREDYKREQEKANFFFNLEYKQLLKNKLEALNTVKKQLKEDQLPPFEKVFFVHYQCENFKKGKAIFNLSIYADDASQTFTKNEQENILAYSEKVKELMSRGLVLIHWGQNRSYYGTQHLNDRYKELTGEALNLEYRRNINLSEWLVSSYGENYISHPRLNKLAELNQFNGIEQADRSESFYSENRLLLLTKIYFNALRGTLKTNVSNPQPQQSQQNRKKNKSTVKNLKDLFKEPEKYTTVMAILIEEKRINKDTHYWTDEEKGNKGYLASFIKHLHTKKYLKYRPTNKEVEVICKNTFGQKISVDTIKRAKENTFHFNSVPPNET